MSHWQEWEQQLAIWHARRTGDDISSSCAALQQRGATWCHQSDGRVEAKVQHLSDEWRCRPTSRLMHDPAEVPAGASYD